MFAPMLEASRDIQLNLSCEKHGHAIAFSSSMIGQWVQRRQVYFKTVGIRLAKWTSYFYRRGTLRLDFTGYPDSSSS
jgi:hypothetical protein